MPRWTQLARGCELQRVRRRSRSRSFARSFRCVSPVCAVCSGSWLSSSRLLLQEREPLSDVGRVFDVLCAACANVATAMSTSTAGGSSQAKAEAGLPRPTGIPPGSPAVTADEMLAEVFSPLAEEAGMDGLYLRAALVEYLRAADAAGVPVPSALPVLLV